ncbi:hypothetical protein K7432_012108 [Basidiobolus ranarum]|uniref:DNA recombination and repair protein Rad51-like C-terminal domain-containing protein n=1 Tax=Basidiobolus ranarum TaxID=34480 RepID=A0ABR2VSS6_9FUNG
MSWSSLITEITSETGLQLYNSIKGKRSIGPLYLDCFDRSIAIARNELEKYLADPVTYTSVYPGEVIQFDGNSGTGKTEIQIFLILTTIIPEFQEFQVNQDMIKVHLGGRGKSVIFIDTEGKLRVERIFELVKLHFVRCLRKVKVSAYDELHEEINQLILEWLERVHIFRPNSTLQLLSTIKRLPSYLSQLQESTHFLFLDSPSTFYWMDRLESQSLGTFVPLHKSLAQSIRDISLEWGLVVCISNPVLLSPEKREYNSGSSLHDSLVIREHLPPIWKECINYRFIIAHEEVGQSRCNDPKVGIFWNKSDLRIGKMVTPMVGQVFRFHVNGEGVVS